VPPYDAISLEHLALMLGIGVLAVIAVALARSSRWLGLTASKKTDEQLEAEVKQFGGDVSETQRPVPWLIWLVFVGYFVWATAYVILAGVRGL